MQEKPKPCDASTLGWVFALFGKISEQLGKQFYGYCQFWDWIIELYIVPVSIKACECGSDLGPHGTFASTGKAKVLCGPKLLPYLR